MKNLFVLFFMVATTCFTLNAQDAVAVAVSNTIENSVESADLHWDQKSYEFGNITQNVPAKATFTLTNNSDQPLLLKQVKPTCGCTVAAYDQEAILPGESTVISTTYNAKKEGSFHKTIKVLTNLSEKEISLKLKGTVVKAKL